MCGIVGYVGHRQCLPILMEGLKRLEYRGYDSAGVAIQENGHLEVSKAAGKIRVLEARLNGHISAFTETDVVRVRLFLFQ